MRLLIAALLSAALLGTAYVAAQSTAGAAAAGADWMNQWVASGGSVDDLMKLVRGSDTAGAAAGNAGSAPGAAVASPPATTPGMPVRPPNGGGVGGGEPHWHHWNGNNNGNDDVTLRPARILLGSSNEMIFFTGTCDPNPCKNGGVCHPRYSAALLSGSTSTTTNPPAQQVYCSCPAQYSGPKCEYDTCLHAVCKDADSPTLVVPADVIVECGESTDPNDEDGTGAALATDVCFTVGIGRSDVESPLSPVQPNCPLAETINRTFTATSSCNLTTVGSQLIYVVKEKPPKVRAALNPTAPLAISASQLSLTPEQSIQLLLLAAGVAIDLKEAGKLGALRSLVGGGTGLDVAKDSLFGGLIDRLALDRKFGSDSLAGKPDGLGDMLRSVGLVGATKPVAAAATPVATSMPARPLLPVGSTIVNVPDNTVDMKGQPLGSGDDILSKVDREVIFAQWLKFGTRVPVGATVCNTPTLRAFRVVCSAFDRCTLQTLGTVFTPGTAGGSGSMFGMAASAAGSSVGVGNALNPTATIVVRRVVGRKSIGFQGINFDPKAAALDADLRRLEEEKARLARLKDLKLDDKFGDKFDSVLLGGGKHDKRAVPLSVEVPSVDPMATPTTTMIGTTFVPGRGISDADILSSPEFARQRSGSTVLSAPCQTRVDTYEVPCGSIIVAKLDAEDACLQDDFLVDSPWHLERTFVRSDFESDPFAGDVDAWKGRTSFGAHLFRGTTVSLRVSVKDVCSNTGYGFDDPSRDCETFVAGVCCPPITNALTQFELSQIRGDPRPQAQELLTATVQKFDDKLGGGIGGVSGGLGGSHGVGGVGANPGVQQAADQLRNLFGGNNGNGPVHNGGGIGGPIHGGGVGGIPPMMPVRP